MCVERGALQGFQRYKVIGFSMVGEAACRLVFALLFYAAGARGDGRLRGPGRRAHRSSAAVLTIPLFRRLPHVSHDAGKRLRDLLAGSGVPVIGLTLLFALQEVHVIVVKHEASSDAAGSYAVAAVAAKSIIWVAVGPRHVPAAGGGPPGQERRRPASDPPPHACADRGLASVPMVLIYAAAAKPLLSAVFGPDLADASTPSPGSAWPWRCWPACTCRCSTCWRSGGRNFIPILAVVAVMEVVLLIVVGANLLHVALALFGLQIFCASGMLTLALRRAPEQERPGEYLTV